MGRPKKHGKRGGNNNNSSQPLPPPPTKTGGEPHMNESNNNKRQRTKLKSTKKRTTTKPPPLPQTWIEPIVLVLQQQQQQSYDVEEETMNHNNEEEELRLELNAKYDQLLAIKYKLWPSALHLAKDMYQAHYNNNNNNNNMEEEEEEEEIIHELADQLFQKARREVADREEEILKPLYKYYTNRSALKLANIHYLLSFSLIGTNSSSSSHQQKSSIFSFLDLCGAPGGFSEYILEWIGNSKQQLQARGFGMSLIGENKEGDGLEWRPFFCNNNNNNNNTLLPTPSSTYEYHICKGSDGTGDLYNLENIEALLSLLESSGSRKVDLVTGDGGFDLQRNHVDQEGLSLRLVTAQLYTALLSLNYEGTFILKMFGFRYEYSRLLLLLLRSLFKEINLLKPITSRPGSAERYVVCTGYQGSGSINHDGAAGDYADIINLLKQVISEDTDWRSTEALCVFRECHRLSSSAIEYLICKFDLNMVDLNIRICFDILSNLERSSSCYLMKNFSSTQCSSENNNGEDGDGGTTRKEHFNKNNINKKNSNSNNRHHHSNSNRYKQVWKIGSKTSQ